MRKLIILAIIIVFKVTTFTQEIKTLYPAKLIRVIDADTVELDISVYPKISITEKCRLYGIDTPESRTKNLIEKQAGIKAKGKLKELIANKDIYIHIHSFGKFGRPLITLYITISDVEFSVNDYMVKNKYAKEYYGDKKEVWTEEELNYIINKE